MTKSFKPSGVNIPDKDRRTVKLGIRCDARLAADVRRLTIERGITMADVLAAGLKSLGG